MVYQNIEMLCKPLYCECIDNKSFLAVLLLVSLSDNWWGQTLHSLIHLVCNGDVKADGNGARQPFLNPLPVSLHFIGTLLGCQQGDVAQNNIFRLNPVYI